MSITIEKNVKMTKPKSRPLKYPFNKCEVNDSFFIAGALITDISPAARAYGERHGMKFSCRTVNKGVRVWRVK